MTRICGTCLSLLLTSVSQAGAQAGATSQDNQTLIPIGAIPLPNVEGRIDHFGLDPGGRLFVAVVGNDTVEVLDTSSERRVHSIRVPHPQGVVYVPEFQRLFVGSRDGKLFIYDGTSLGLITSIDFHGDVDNLRYDPATKRVYVGWGDGAKAGIAAIDAANN